MARIAVYPAALVVITLAAGALAGCGQSGPLFLPRHQSPAPNNASKASGGSPEPPPSASRGGKAPSGGAAGGAPGGSGDRAGGSKAGSAADY